uniref:Carboxypeptidase inhibitor n=1 Tax=Rhipicephalus zambeziensis TaxID=60191 RepID=A0A224Y2M3_9ACAR
MWKNLLPTLPCVRLLVLFSLITLFVMVFPETAVEARKKNLGDDISTPADLPVVLERMNIENGQRKHGRRSSKCTKNGGKCNKTCTGSSENKKWPCKNPRKKCCVYLV